MPPAKVEVDLCKVYDSEIIHLSYKPFVPHGWITTSLIPQRGVVQW